MQPAMASTQVPSSTLARLFRLSEPACVQPEIRCKHTVVFWYVANLL